MIETLKNFLRNDTERMTAQPAMLARTAAGIRTELDRALGAQEAVDKLLNEACHEREEAQRSYDIGIDALAEGRGPEPDRGPLAAASSKADGLHRNLVVKRRDVARLRAELEAAELAEGEAADWELLSWLIPAAEAAVSDFEQAIAEAWTREDVLFRLLFDVHDGLKRQLVTRELNAEAQRVRRAIVRRLLAYASRYRYLLDDRFELDGEANLGEVEVRFAHDKLIGKPAVG